jgi:ferredoxin--NADP+ reductase
VHFVFNATPVAVFGKEDVKAIRMRHTGSDNSYWDVACGMVIGAIGFRGRPLPGVPFDPVRRIVPNDNGKVQDALYAVGWIKRGPSGVIGTSKPDGTVAAHGILQEFPQGGSKPGRPAFVDFLARRKIDWIGFDGWKRIDRAERSAARPGSPRQKLFRVADMLMHAKIE